LTDPKAGKKVCDEFKLALTSLDLNLIYYFEEILLIDLLVV
jgi:hypothetical protein